MCVEEFAKPPYHISLKLSDDLISGTPTIKPLSTKVHCEVFITQFFPSENTYRQLDVRMPITIRSYIYQTTYQVLFKNGHFLYGNKYLKNVFVKYF